MENIKEVYKKYIRDILLKKGWTATELARKAGIAHTTLSRFLNSPEESYKSIPTISTLNKIAAVSGVPFPNSEKSEEQKSIFVDPSTFPRDIPLLGTDTSDKADFKWTGHTVGFAKRPPGIVGNKTVIAFWIPTNTMSPRHQRGQLMLAETTRPAADGDDVIIEIDSGNCYLGKLQAMSKNFEIKQLNPNKVFNIPKNEIKKIYRILSTAELLGV